MFDEEKNIQIQIIRYIQIKYPNVLFTIAPAGQKRGTRIQRIIAGAEAKRMGYRKGCPDILIFERNKEYSGLFIEVKTMIGAKKPEQKEFVQMLLDRGYYACFCRGYQQAVSKIDNYMSTIKTPEGKGGENGQDNKERSLIEVCQKTRNS